MEKEKVKGVLEWPMPKCIKDVQKFLGLANYYRQFIEGFAMVARLLHNLVKKDKKWDWMERQEVAFKELKEWCYDLKLKELSNKTTLVLSNTRELDRVPSTK